MQFDAAKGACIRLLRRGRGEGACQRRPAPETRARHEAIEQAGAHSSLPAAVCRALPIHLWAGSMTPDCSGKIAVEAPVCGVPLQELALYEGFDALLDDSRVWQEPGAELACDLGHYAIVIQNPPCLHDAHHRCLYLRFPVLLHLQPSLVFSSCHVRLAWLC